MPLPYFISVCTVTNGVLMTDANRGQIIEYRCVMQNSRTGAVHRVMDCNGTYVGTWVDYRGVTYAMFENGYIGHKFQTEMGTPLAFFTPGSRGIDLDEMMRPHDFIL